jgi:hypothetical protein
MPINKSLTVPEMARRHRVSEEKVRAWIRSGILRAVNTANTRCGKPRFVIFPEAIEEFERARSVATPPPAPKRNKRIIRKDYYPD